MTRGRLPAHATPLHPGRGAGVLPGPRAGRRPRGRRGVPGVRRPAVAPGQARPGSRPELRCLPDQVGVSASAAARCASLRAVARAPGGPRRSPAAPHRLAPGIEALPRAHPGGPPGGRGGVPGVRNGLPVHRGACSGPRHDRRRVPGEVGVQPAQRAHQPGPPRAEAADRPGSELRRPEPAGGRPEGRRGDAPAPLAPPDGGRPPAGGRDPRPPRRRLAPRRHAHQSERRDPPGLGRRGADAPPDRRPGRHDVRQPHATRPGFEPRRARPPPQADPPPAWACSRTP